MLQDLVTATWSLRYYTAALGVLHESSLPVDVHYQSQAAILPNADCADADPATVLQVFKSEPYSESADIFAMAVIMYEMFTRRSILSRVSCCSGGTHKEVRTLSSCLPSD